MSGEPRSYTATLIREAGGEFIALPELRVRVSGSGQDQAVALGIDPVVVGSTPDCDLVVKDPYVSRRHCALTLTDKGVLVRDLGSRNGIWVQSIRIHEALLPHGGGVQLGQLALTVEAGNQPVRVMLSPGQQFGEAVGKSMVMRVLFARLEKAARTDEPMLLLGESGTGKELLARGIHEASPRKEGPFVVFDCSAVAPSLVESELFGHEKGAFTGAHATRAGLVEAARGGTLFLDELGELPLELQPKLLRMLENRSARRVGSNQAYPIDVRIVAATHRDLSARVAAGEFREDLFYRLAVVEMRIPPLRERREDIPLLVERILAKRTPPATIADLPPNTLPMLEAHNWPGNVRELRNMLSRVLLFQANDVLGAPPAEPLPPTQDKVRLDIPFHAAKDAIVGDFERRYVTAQLEAHAGNVSSAARAMGVSRQFLHKLISEHGLSTRAANS
jgi:two-component system, NtrC family, response regulator GlrR